MTGIFIEPKSCVLGRLTPYLAILAILLTACATPPKSEEDLSFLGKFYHNTTAKYNGYFNANELLEASNLQLADQYQENYLSFLPVFPYAEAENPQAVARDLDEAIKKISIVVNLHRPSQWTDDCYLLLGKAQYLKQDYEAAEKSLRYLVAEFDPEDMEEEAVEEKEKEEEEAFNQKKARRKYNKMIRKKKRKERKGKYVEAAAIDPKSPAERRKEEEERRKEEEAAEALAQGEEEEKEKEEGYFMKHRPAYQEGKLWLAKTLIERDNFSSAERVLNELLSDPATFDDVRRDAWAASAHLQIEQGEYALAVEPLQQAIERSNDRQQRARYAYLIGQIQTELGQTGQAVASFEQAMDFKPSYEMAFNARLQMTMSEWKSGAKSSPGTTEALEKLLKDEKNLEYQDQLYYSLATIALKDGDRAAGREYLQMALNKSSRNPSQKAEAYYQLAELYYEVQDYVGASAYFDSALQVMPQQDPRYARVNKLAKNLKDIAANILMVETQDSLLRLSELSMEEKKEMAFLLQQKQEAERLSQATARAAGGTASAGRPTVANLGGQQTSSFFAYDDRKKRQGMREFDKRWGDRPLEDNWRRSNRNDNLKFREEETAEAIPVAAETMTEEQVNSILQGVPTDDSERALAEKKIIDALYKLGTLYRDRLENNRKAIEAFEELNRRFPNNNYKLDSWYYLYITHSETGNTSAAQGYADQIIRAFPNSNYARVLQDPNYLDQLVSGEERLQQFYDQTYIMFEEGQYEQVQTRIRQARQRFGGANALQAKFALLEAFCIGKAEGESAYRAALQQVIGKYPNTDEQRRAREILRLLGGAQASLPGGEESGGNFQLNDDQLHYVIVTFNGVVDLNEAKVALADYNRQYHNLENLRISNVFLGRSNNPQERTPIIVVRRFKNRPDAMKYYEGIQQNKEDFIDSGINYEVFAINMNNYREVIRTKSINEYRNFFLSNYIQ